MKKRLMTAILAVVLCFALSLSCFAAEHDVADFDELYTAWTSDTDDTVTLVLKADIEMWDSLNALKGKTYVIKNEDGSLSEYIVKNVSIYGEGFVEINTDVEGTDDRDALSVWESAEVVVNGDVTGGDADNAYGGDSAGTGVYAEENAKVTVNGNVTGGSGTAADPETDGYVDGGDGIAIDNGAQVTVNGNVQGGNAQGIYAYGGDGVEIYGYGQVTVNGNVQGGDTLSSKEDCDNARAGFGVIIEEYNGGEKSTVTVSGDVAAGSLVGGESVYADGAGYAADGILVYVDGSSVEIKVDGNVQGGNVEGSGSLAGNGITVGNYGGEVSIAVGGNVQGGSVEGDDSKAGTGVSLKNSNGSATVEIGGNVNGGSGEGEDTTAGDGVNIGVMDYEEEEASTVAVTVEGNAKGGSTAGDGSSAGNGVLIENDGYHEETAISVAVEGSAVGGNSDGNGSEAGQGLGVIDYGPGKAEALVKGDAIGGDASGDESYAGNGIVFVVFEPMDEEKTESTLCVEGTAKGGAATGEDSESGSAMLIFTDLFFGNDTEVIEALLEGEDIDEDMLNTLVTMAMFNKYLGEFTLEEIMNLTNEQLEAMAVGFVKELAQRAGVEVPEGFDGDDVDFAEELMEKILADKELVKELQDEAASAVSMILLEQVEVPHVEVWALSDENGGMVATNALPEKLALAMMDNITDYIIKVEQPENGEITANKELAREGEEVIFTVKADEGYEIKSVSNGHGKVEENEDGSYSFTVEAGGAYTISAEIAKAEPAGGSGVPSTGDNANMAGWIALMGGAAAALLCAVYYRKRKITE